MSLQDGPVEGIPDPSCENKYATTPWPIPVEFDGELDRRQLAKLAVRVGTRLDIMKSWIKTCNEHHGSPCVIPKADATVWPAWLIDVVDACIVEGDVAERYLALSYVWGGVQTLQLDTKNVDRLIQHGSLTNEEVTLPRTIQEALKVTRLLGERYIFIDQLCIVQDDLPHKMAEIEHMAEIYANAYITLVATAGCTAASGLADNIEQWIYHYPVVKRLNSYIEDHHGHRVEAAVYSTQTVWNTRGWTFQEGLSAGRILHFLSNMTTYENCIPPFFRPHGSDYASWSCGRAWWHDLHGKVTIGSDPRLHSAHSSPRPIRPLTWPDFSRYQSLVRSYISRYFTYDSDVVPAFAGAASALAKVFPGGILYGLPIVFFDVALMWTFDEIQAIRAIDTTSCESLRAPSWSWMSWRGKTAYGSWNRFAQTLETIPGGHPDWSYDAMIYSPIVQWSYIGAEGAQIAIENGYSKYRHFAHDSESTPPLGWDRITPSTIDPKHQLKFYYTTRAAPGHMFRFPIPLVDLSDAAVTIPEPISSVITCQTERAYFYLAGEHAFENWKALSIIDSKGHDSGRFLEFGDTHGPTKVNQKVELIAISYSLEGNINDCEQTLLMGNRRTEDQPDGGVKEWYNVLWIEWTDDIAYRRAVGQITKEAWGAADREHIHVKLG